MTMSRSDIQISVVIPACNIETYIERAINSVLLQRHTADEIIVVDDGSKDGTAEKIKAYGDKVTYLYQDNRGLSGARNTGIRQSKYDWVAFLDGDDEWLPDYLERQIAILTGNPELRWSAGNFLCCLCDEHRVAPSVAPRTIRALMGPKTYFENFFYAHANGACGHPNTIMIHKEIFDTVGLFNEQQAFAEDLEMWWRIAFRYPQVGYVAEPCAIYHMQRPGTLTEAFKASKHRQLRLLLETNQRHAADNRMSRQFAPLVRFLVTSWIRGLLFENRPDDIRELLSKFDRSLSHYFRLWVAVLLLWPKGSAVLLQWVSRWVRKTGLRKKITRPPTLLKE